MIRLRRKLSRVLARWAVMVDPDPPLKFTTRVGEGFSEATLGAARRLDRATADLTPELTAELARIVSGQIVGYGVASRRFKPGDDGKDVSY